MFIQLNHKLLDVYVAAREFAKEVCNISMLLPSEEKFNMVPQMRGAVLSVKLGLAEAALNYLKVEELKSVGEYLNKYFSMFSKMIGN